MMKRLQSNLEIANRICQVAAQNPDLRFGQILVALGVVLDKRHPVHLDELYAWEDEFYLESDELLDRVNAIFEVTKGNFS